MATVTWTPYPDGHNLGTLRASINTFNTAVVTDITAVETSITSLGSTKISKADTGLVFVTGATMPSVSLTTAYQKVGMVGTTTVNKANSHFTVDNVNYTYTVNTTGVYKLVFSGAMTADTGKKVTFNYNVNGVSSIANPPEFLGDGARLVEIGNHFVIELTAGAVIHIEAKCDSTATLVPINCGFTLEKTHY